MSEPTLYRGPWPQNVSRLAKYALKSQANEIKITVLYEAGEGLWYLAVEGGSSALAQRINAIKLHFTGRPGGAFYINEYRHVLVPVSDGGTKDPGSMYYYAGRLEDDLRFEFEGKRLTTKPIDFDGTPLKPGDRWIGPRPGIPYVLAAGGGDIYYETPALTDDDPPKLRPGVTRRVQLSKVLGDKAALMRAVRPVAQVRGHQGGRFYVNEQGAMFSPVGGGDGNGIDYVYCGQIDRTAWFPEPAVS